MWKLSMRKRLVVSEVILQIHLPSSCMPRFLMTIHICQHLIGFFSKRLLQRASRGNQYTLPLSQQNLICTCVYVRTHVHVPVYMWVCICVCMACWWRMTPVAPSGGQCGQMSTGDPVIVPPRSPAGCVRRAGCGCCCRGRSSSRPLRAPPGHNHTITNSATEGLEKNSKESHCRQQEHRSFAS